VKLHVSDCAVAPLGSEATTNQNWGPDEYELETVIIAVDILSVVNPLDVSY